MFACGLYIHKRAADSSDVGKVHPDVDMTERTICYS